MVNLPVLVLNQNYETLNICPVRRAIVLLFCGKAEAVENGAGQIRTVSEVFALPSVIRLTHMIKRLRFRRKMSRIEIFNRDGYTCQYCGKESHTLTLDHIIPRSRGGEHSWENVVSCCVRCNRHKAGHTPVESGMRLISTPQLPPPDGFRVPVHYLQNHNEWRKYIPGQA